MPFLSPFGARTKKPPSSAQQSARRRLAPKSAYLKIPKVDRDAFTVFVSGFNEQTCVTFASHKFNFGSTGGV
jgi:hypothetical protein